MDREGGGRPEGGGGSCFSVNKRASAEIQIKTCPFIPALVPTLPPKWALVRWPSPPPSAFSLLPLLPSPYIRAQAAPSPVPSEGRDLPGGARSPVTPFAESRCPISRPRGLRQTSILRSGPGGSNPPSSSTTPCVLPADPLTCGYPAAEPSPRASGGRESGSGRPHAVLVDGAVFFFFSSAPGSWSCKRARLCAREGA